MRRKHYETLAVLGILSSAVASNSTTVHADANSSQVETKTDSQDIQNQSSDDEATLSFNKSINQDQGQNSNTDATDTASPDSTATAQANQSTDTEKSTDAVAVNEDNVADSNDTSPTINSSSNSLVANSLVQSDKVAVPASNNYIPAKSYGVDVSGYQGTDLTKYAQAGAKYTIVKLSEGTWYTNPNAQGQVNSAKKLNMATYAYHFANFSNNAAEAEKEANFAIQKAQKVGIKPGTYFAIDWETEGNANVVDGNTEQNTSAILAFMRKVSAAGYKPLVYTGAYNFQNHLNVSEIIKQFPNSLWVASYKTTGEIDEPDFNYFPSMEGVAIWQFTSNWRGLHVDANVNVLPLSSNASTTDDKDKAISVNYQVVDDDNNGAVVASGTFSGKNNTSLSNRSIIDSNAPDVLNKYVLASPDKNNLLNSSSRTITIHVSHKTETVTDTHNATFIIYDDSSTTGNVGPASGVSKKYTFSRTGTKDLATGHTTWGQWSAPETLKYGKYTFTVTSDSPDTKISITSKGVLITTESAPHKVTNTVNFVDNAGKTIKTTTVSANDQNQTIDISNLIPEGYQLADSASNSLISGDNGSFFNVAIVKNNTDSNKTDSGNDPSSSDSGKSDSKTDTTPTNPDDSHNGSSDSSTDNTDGKADSSVTNIVEFVDENSNIVGSTTINAEAAGKNFTLNSNSIPAGYKLANDASLTLTAKDNGATIQIKVVADANTDNSSNQNNPAPITPDDSGTADKGTSGTSTSSDNAKDTSNGATGTSSTIPSWDSVNSNGSAVIDSGMANILGSGIASPNSDNTDNGLSSLNYSNSASAASFAPGTAVSAESGDAAPASSNSVLPQTGNSANAHKAKTAGIMMLLAELFASMGLMQKRDKKQQVN